MNRVMPKIEETIVLEQAGEFQVMLAGLPDGDPLRDQVEGAMSLMRGEAPGDGVYTDEDGVERREFAVVKVDPGEVPKLRDAADKVLAVGGVRGAFYRVRGTRRAAQNMLDNLSKAAQAY
jgi:hypothetical protein